MFLIRHRSDRTFLKGDPLWGRLLQWAAHEQSARRYTTREQAEGIARGAWLSDWMNRVEVIETKDYRVQCYNRHCRKEIAVGDVEKEAADRGAMFFCCYGCFCE